MGTVEEVKEILTNTRNLKRYVFSEYFRKDEDEPDYPNRFWNVELYTYRVSLDDCSIPRDLVDWNFQSSFQTATIEEAVSYAVVGGQDDKEFDAVELPDRLQDHWYKNIIDARESVYIKEKWGDRQLRSSAGFTVYDVFKHDIIESWSESSLNLNYVLTKIPSTLIRLSETLPYGFSTPDIMKENPEVKFPYFIYKGYVFKTTHYIHDQRCICGECAEYYDEYNGDNSIKIEIWDVDHFLQDGIIYSDDGWYYYNGQRIKAKEVLENAKDHNGVMENLKQQFPDAGRFESWEGSYTL